MTNAPGLDEKKLVMSSWQRCVSDYRLSRDASKPILRLRDAEVGPRRKKFVDLPDGDTSELDGLFRIAQRAQHYAVVADAECVLVMHDPAAAWAADYEHVGIVDGACWNEQIAATNGVAMALRHRHPVTVAGKDHYYQLLAPFQCSAAPLLNHCDEPIGAINISSLDQGSRADRIFSQHLVALAAAKIQARLFHARYRDHLRASLRVVGGETDETVNALIAIDGSGQIIAATNAGARVADRTAPNGLIGRNVGSIFDATIDELAACTGAAMEVDAGRDRPLIVLPIAPRQSRPTATSVATRRIGRTGPVSLREIAGDDSAALAMVERAERLFRASVPMHISGGTATGKRTLVRALHREVTYSQGVLITVDCGRASDISADEFATSFTRTLERARAHSHASDGSVNVATLMIERVDELEDHLQKQLVGFLRKLENVLDGPSLGREPKGLRVIVTSSSKSIEDAGADALQTELAAHFAGGLVAIRPLRYRNDLSSLIIRVAQRILGRPARITDDAMALLIARSWFGNYRELVGTLRGALVLSDGKAITPFDLADGMSAPHRPPEKLKDQVDLVHDADASLVRDALCRANWNVSKAAKTLQISRATLHRRMVKLKLIRPSKQLRHHIGQLGNADQQHSV